MTNKCTSVVGLFDGHGGAPEQYRQHCPMGHVRGYPGSHWTLPSCNYLLCIAPAAARATANDTTTKNGPTLLAILMAVVVHRYDTAHIAAEIFGDPYYKKSPLPSIGKFPHLANSPKLSSYRVLGQSRIQQKHTTHYNHPRIEAQ